MSKEFESYQEVAKGVFANERLKQVEIPNGKIIKFLLQKGFSRTSDSSGK